MSWFNRRSDTSKAVCTHAGALPRWVRVEDTGLQDRISTCTARSAILFCRHRSPTGILSSDVAQSPAATGSSNRTVSGLEGDRSGSSTVNVLPAPRLLATVMRP